MNLKRLAVAALMACTFGLIAAEEVTMPEPKEGEVRKEFDWCTVQLPEKAAPKSKVTVYVTLKNDIPAGLKLFGDLHFATKDSYQGYGAWGGRPKKAVGGKTYKLTYTTLSNEDEDEELGTQLILFLSKNGWNDAVKKAPCPLILPVFKK